MPNIHPIIVHFATALIVTAVAFEAVGWLFNRPSLKTVGWWNLLTAALSSAAAVLSGLWAEDNVPHIDAAHSLMETHETIGLVTLALAVVLFVGRTVRRGALVQRFRPLYLLGLLAVLATVTYGGWLGGEMVFRHGVGVRPVMESAATADHEHDDDDHNDDAPTR